MYLVLVIGRTLLVHKYFCIKKNIGKPRHMYKVAQIYDEAKKRLARRDSILL